MCYYGTKAGYPKRHFYHASSASEDVWVNFEKTCFLYEILFSDLKVSQDALYQVFVYLEVSNIFIFKQILTQCRQKKSQRWYPSCYLLKIKKRGEDKLTTYLSVC